MPGISSIGSPCWRTTEQENAMTEITAPHGWFKDIKLYVDDTGGMGHPVRAHSRLAAVWCGVGTRSLP